MNGSSILRYLSYFDIIFVITHETPPSQVADDKDPYFLYLLDVGEQDFHFLKRDQALLVEFGVFPSKFIELIEWCLQCGPIVETMQQDDFLVQTRYHTPTSSHSTESSDLTSTFVAKLDIGERFFFCFIARNIVLIR